MEPKWQIQVVGALIHCAALPSQLCSLLTSKRPFRLVPSAQPHYSVHPFLLFRPSSWSSLVVFHHTIGKIVLQYKVFMTSSLKLTSGCPLPLESLRPLFSVISPHSPPTQFFDKLLFFQMDALSLASRLLPMISLCMEYGSIPLSPFDSSLLFGSQLRHHML